MSAPFLELRAVTCRTHTGGGLEALSLSVERGEFVSLYGKTGTGKSTILALLSGRIVPEQGAVIVAGQSLEGYTEAQRRWLRRSMGLMPQEGQLLEDRSVLDNVMLPALVAEHGFKEARMRAEMALTKCGVAELAALFPRALSAGQRQLVCLARAVVNRPAVILADDPMVHLDAENQTVLLNLLATFARAGVTVIVTGHDPLEPANLTVRTINLDTLQPEEVHE